MTTRITKRVLGGKECDVVVAEQDGHEVVVPFLAPADDPEIRQALIVQCAGRAGLGLASQLLKTP